MTETSQERILQRAAHILLNVPANNINYCYSRLDFRAGEYRFDLDHQDSTGEYTLAVYRSGTLLAKSTNAEEIYKALRARIKAARARDPWRQRVRAESEMAAFFGRMLHDKIFGGLGDLW